MCQPLDLTAVRESYCLTTADLQGEPLTTWRCALANALDELEEARAERDRNGAELKPLADVNWLLIGSTNEYADLKKWIAHICRDVTHAACIDELCINDICVGFRQKGYEIVTGVEIAALQARLRVFELEHGGEEQ